MEISFCDLRCKVVINLCDGRRLGHIIDIIFDRCCGKILGIVVPGFKKRLNFFKSGDDIFIPFHCICKIGCDAILVDLQPVNEPHRCDKDKRHEHGHDRGVHIQRCSDRDICSDNAIYTHAERN